MEPLHPAVKFHEAPFGPLSRFIPGELRRIASEVRTFAIRDLYRPTESGYYPKLHPDLRTNETLPIETYLAKAYEIYKDPADRIKLRDACEYGLKSHGGQRRKSGTLYFPNHCVPVASWLLQFLLPVSDQITALLHDVPEDTGNPLIGGKNKLQEIELMFGREVAFKIEGVSRVKYDENGNLRSRESEHAYTIYKLLSSMAVYPSIGLIKLADRRHNVYTFEALGPVKAKDKAWETVKVYLLIADLLGLYGLRNELAEECFKYTHPDQVVFMNSVAGRFTQELGNVESSLRSKFMPWQVLAEATESSPNLSLKPIPAMYRRIAQVLTKVKNLLGEESYLWEIITGYSPVHLSVAKPTIYELYDYIKVQYPDQSGFVKTNPDLSEEVHSFLGKECNPRIYFGFSSNFAKGTYMRYFLSEKVRKLVALNGNPIHEQITPEGYQTDWNTPVDLVRGLSSKFIQPHFLFYDFHDLPYLRPLLVFMARRDGSLRQGQLLQGFGQVIGNHLAQIFRYGVEGAAETFISERPDKLISVALVDTTIHGRLQPLIRVGEGCTIMDAAYRAGILNLEEIKNFIVVTTEAGVQSQQQLQGDYTLSYHPQRLIILNREHGEKFPPSISYLLSMQDPFALKIHRGRIRDEIGKNRNYADRFYGEIVAVGNHLIRQYFLAPKIPLTNEQRSALDSILMLTPNTVTDSFYHMIALCDPVDYLQKLISFATVNAK